MDPLVGRTLDNKYLIENLLGKGGMGSVYMAVHTGTKRPVAVKVIAPQFMRNRELLIRFQREAEAAGRLRHPNVVNVTDFGVTIIDQSAVAYLVMEYLDGETLYDSLQRQAPMHPDLALDVLEQIALGITEAHSHGILHRDLKPQNIWLQPDGRGAFIVKVLDFGIAKLADPSALTMELPEMEAAPNAEPVAVDENATQAISATESGFSSAFAEASGFTTTVGSTLGTPAFMAPEQCSGQVVSEKSDLYSLAMLAYWMLAGELPFKGTARELIEQQISQSPTPPHMRNDKLSESISRVILESLAKNPERRAPSPISFVARLRAAVNGESSVFKEARITMSASAFSWFAPVLAIAVAAGLLMFGLRFVARLLFEKDIVREFPLALTLFFANFAITLAMMLWLDLAAVLCMLANRRDGELTLRSFRAALETATLGLPGAIRACLLSGQPISGAISHIVLALESESADNPHSARLSLAQARQRSAGLLEGFRPTVIALWIRRITVATLIVLYIPLTFMIAAAPLPVIWREYIGKTGNVLGWISFTLLPLYCQFVFAWYGLYERGRKSLGEATASVQQVYTKSGRVGQAWKLGTRLWAAGFFLVLLIMILPPFFGWNDKFGDSLPSAVLEGRFKDVLALLDNGDDVNQISARGGRTLLMAAVENGDLPIVNLLLERGAKLDHVSPGGTALHRAVITKRLNMLEHLLNKGANPNLFDNTHDTPLALAAKNGFLEGAKLLLDRGCDPNHKDMKGLIALDHAKQQGHRGIVILLEGTQGSPTHEHAH